MASIRKRPRTDGSLSYAVLYRLAGSRKQHSKTFRDRDAALKFKAAYDAAQAQRRYLDAIKVLESRRADEMSNECIDIAEMLPYTLGRAINNIWNYGPNRTEVLLRDARWYLRRTITNGCSTHLPPKAKRLLETKLDRRDRDLSHTLLSHILNGQIETAINIISVTLVANEARIVP